MPGQTAGAAPKTAHPLDLASAKRAAATCPPLDAAQVEQIAALLNGGAA